MARQPISRSASRASNESLLARGLDNADADPRVREYGERPHGVGNFETNYDLASARPRRIDSSIGGWNDHRGKGPRNYRPSDERRRERLCEMLTDDPRVDATHIDVHVQDGEITLSGFVDSRRTKFLVEELVANTCDTEVTNRLRVRPPADASAARELSQNWFVD